MKKEITERERRILDRQMDRLERCLIADEKAENARRRYWRRRGGIKAQLMAEYEERRKRREEKPPDSDAPQRA